MSDQPGLYDWVTDEMFEEALKAFDRVVELDPGHAKAHRYRGVSLDLLGRGEALRFASWAVL